MPTIIPAAEYRTSVLDGEITFADVGHTAVSIDGWLSSGLDPHTEAYHEAVLGSWSRLAGRREYVATDDESFEVDPTVYLARPYPYSSGDPEEVGRYLGAVAGAVGRVGRRPPATVVEYGSGWGHLALSLASTGFDVTAVDLNRPSVELLRRRAHALEVPLRVAQSAFLDFAPSEPVDVIVFFESFHHCHRPFELLDRCRSQLRPGGRLLFVADAFYDDFHAPWGIRLDGAAAFMAVTQGWLELGFRRDFFEAELHERGFSTTWEVVAELGAYGTFLIADLPDS